MAKVHRREALGEGYRYYCFRCRRIYKELPKQSYEDGLKGRQITVCGCGCDIFTNIKDSKLVNHEVGAN